MRSFTFAAVVSTLCAVSVAADKLAASGPKGLVQCDTNTLKWTGGTGPYDVYVYTGCEDDSDDPIFFANNVAGNSVDWTVDAVSGDGILLYVVDSTGADDWADEAYVGGDASDAKSCAAQIKSAGATASAADAADAATATTSAVPTTMVGNGAANAAKGPTFSGSIAAAETNTPVGSGATALSASLRPVALVLGSLAVGAFALL